MSEKRTWWRVGIPATTNEPTIPVKDNPWMTQEPGWVEIVRAPDVVILERTEKTFLRYLIWVRK